MNAKHIICIALLWSWQLALLGQALGTGGDFDPANPGDPQVPVLKHDITLTATPAGSGTFNIRDGQKVGEGEEIRLYAYPEAGFVFRGWVAGDSLLSTTSPYTYRMGKEDVHITARFEYAPTNPANPGRNFWNATTGELIIDDFTPERISSAISEALGRDNASQITQITVSGEMSPNDFGFSNYENCTLVDLSRTYGYTAIPSYGFSYSSNLASVTLPPSVEVIESYAFYDCPALADVTCYAMVPPTLEYSALDGIAEGAVLHVPATAIPLYAEAEGWKDFTILPLQDEVRSIEVSLPADAADGRYKDMTLELVNAETGQRQRYVISDRVVYTFNSLMKNSTFNVYVRNAGGVELGKIENVVLAEEDVKVVFASLLQPHDVTLSVLLPDGTDVTGQATVTWLAADGTYLKQGATLAGQLSGTQLAYRIALPQTLAMQYTEPDQTDYAVTEGDNHVACTLAAIGQRPLNGTLVDATSGQPLNGATVSVSQVLNGKYSKAFTLKTDARGVFAQTVFDAPTSVTASASDYVSLTVDSVAFGADGSIGQLALKPVTGVTITTNLTYTESVADGETADTTAWYPDYANVAYAIYNETQGRAVTQFNVQYPQIVLLEDAAVGDRLRLTASSKTSAFVPVEAVTTVGEDNRAEATFAIIGLGGIRASFTSTDNAAVVGLLYGSNGQLVKKYRYSEAQLTIDNLADGTYTLVSMADNELFNSILNLSEFAASGLAEGTDYVQNAVTVKSGSIALVTNDMIPALDETKLYYTGDRTSFTVNKTSIVAGNYLTLKGRIDFKPEYASAVSGVNMVVDLPESCSFVENSVMVGAKVSGYTIDGQRLTIPVEDIADDVKFCVIPRSSGDYYISGAAQFELNGDRVQQPIGNAPFSVEEMALTVPEVVCLPKAFISGVAVGNSDVEIYDGNVLIGKTKAIANGVWATVCDLDFPYTLTTHKISAKFITPDGLLLETETKDCFYDKSAIVLSDVTMMSSGEEIKFDFINGEVSKQTYTFTSNDFTFLINFTNNDSTYVDDVRLYVNTMDGGVTRLFPMYDGRKDVWVASSRFISAPTNVNVTFLNKAESEVDSTLIKDIQKEIAATLEAEKATNDKMAELLTAFDEETGKETPDEEVLSTLSDSIDIVLGLTPEDKHYVDSVYNVLLTIIDVENPNDDDIDIIDRFFDDLVEEEIPSAEEFLASWDELPPIDPRPISGGYETPRFTYEKGSGHQGYEDALSSVNWSVAELENESSTTDGITLTNAETGDKVRIDFGNQLPDGGTTTDELRRVGNLAIDLINNAISSYGQGEQGIHKILSQAYRNTAATCSKLYQDPILSRNETFKRYCQGEVRNNLRAAARAETTARRLGVLGNIFTAVTTIQNIKTNVSNSRAWDDLIAKADSLCEQEEAKKIKEKAESYKGWYLRRANTAIGADVGLALGSSVSMAASGPTLGTSCFVTLACNLAGYGVSFWRHNFTRDNDINMNDIRKMIVNSDKCDTDSSGLDDDLPIPPPPLNPVIPQIDPSGYVYEAVSSNRLEGVTATCYYKETVEDMYGDLHENVVLWDAAEYAQENPLFTDENGMYRWDVPQGLWQVRFEKEGYQPTQSEWLPVPPPQLEVNIAMTQNRQPEVKAARAYEGGLEVEFDKYMQPATMTVDNIFATVGGEKVAGAVTLLNEEAAYEGEGESYVSKVRFVPTTPFLATDEVVLTVSRKVKSYAGIQMENDFTQAFDIEKEVKTIVVDSLIKVPYTGDRSIVVSALPYDAAIGKKVAVRSSSPMIAAVSADTLTLDENGQATLTLSGELPGAAALTLTLQDADLVGRSTIQVLDESQIYTAKPVASRASGTAVYRNTEIALSTETPNAVIYYTTDGSCPCDEATRLVYEKPIAITADMTIKAIAVGEGMFESEVAEFNYTIKTATLGLNLSEGWNWISHNMEAPVAATQLGENATRIVSQTEELIADPAYGLTGNLSELRAEQAYKVQVDAATQHTLSGYEHNGTQPITLLTGWNWIGYPVSQTMSLSEALAHTEADEDDYITGQDGFAQFSDGQWTGTLQTLVPGKGYMYHSQTDKQLTYNTAIVSKANALYGKGLSGQAPWAVDKHAYPNVMCLVADVFIDGMKADAGKFSVGAFCGSECRGIGSYVDGRLMMNIYGKGGETITFMAVDNATEQAYTICESEPFAETLLGSLRLPYRLNIGEMATGINAVETGYKVWPAVTNDYVHATASGETIDRVTVIDMSGHIVVAEKNVASGYAISVAHLPEGVYIVTIKDAGQSFYQKIVKTRR